MIWLFCVKNQSDFTSLSLGDSSILPLKSFSSLSPSIFPFSNSPLALPNVLASSGIFLAPKISTPITTTKTMISVLQSIITLLLRFQI